MELETVNKLFLELSQFSTASTAKELALKTLLRKAEEELIHSKKYYTNPGKELLLKGIGEALK